LSRDAIQDKVEESNKNLGVASTKFQDLMDERAVLSPLGGFSNDDAIISSKKKAACDISLRGGLVQFVFRPRCSGMCLRNVCSGGQGKYSAGKALLKHFYDLTGKSMNGFMITGNQLDDKDYFSRLGDSLGVNEVIGWFHALLLAMDVPGRLSILILDSFNSVGDDEVNIDFIKKLYGELNAQKNVYGCYTRRKCCRYALLPEGRKNSFPSSTLLHRRTDCAKMDRDDMDVRCTS
jgi:hypothetical protein